MPDESSKRCNCVRCGVSNEVNNTYCTACGEYYWRERIRRRGEVCGEIYVPCEECGHLNTLRQVGPKARPLSRNELFIAEIREICEEFGSDSQIARDVAQRIFDVLCPSAERYRQGRPFYRVEVLDGSEWYHIKTG